MRRQERLDRLRAVEREFIVAGVSLEFLHEGVRTRPEALASRDLRPRDAIEFAENLEPTYLVRLFAEFESALRDVWAKGYRRKSEPAVRTLIDSVATRCDVSPTNLEVVHRIREFRNSIVHEGISGSLFVEFSEAKSALGKFLARLPLEW